MTKTPIEWTDFTVNPFRFRNKKSGKVGHHCTKISPGCKNCYSSTMQAGPYLSGLTFIEDNKPKGEFFLDERALEQVLRRQKPAKIFWRDMTDMFLEDYPDEWIDRCFAVMALTPQHTHQVLTKRAERMREYFATSPNPKELPTRKSVIEETIRVEHLGDEFRSVSVEWPLPNVWLGVSVENQEYADKRIPELLRTPAAVRFISYEPALGPVDFDLPRCESHGREFAFVDDQLNCECCSECRADDATGEMSFGHWLDPLNGGLDWIIVGGESGRGARPFDIAWAKATVEQCKAAGVAVFVKQLGAHIVASGAAQFGWPIDTVQGLWSDCSVVPPRIHVKDRKGGDMEEWPADLRVREMPEVPRA